MNTNSLREELRNEIDYQVNRLSHIAADKGDAAKETIQRINKIMGLVDLHTQEAVERARVETAKHIILNCKERNYSDIPELPVSYTEYISHNKIMDYIATLTQTKEKGKE